MTLLFALATGAAGCSDGEEASPGETQPRFRERTSLIDHERFELLAAARDPFDDRPSAAHECPSTAYFAEDLGGERVFSVYTDGCSYATFMTPSLVPVKRGEFLNARLWHFALIAPDTAEAHLVVSIDGGSGVEERIPIPKESALIRQSWQAPQDHPAGTPVYFHVHNHGNNEYLLIELSTGSDDPNAP
jgi:hypothetical protein